MKKETKMTLGRMIATMLQVNGLSTNQIQIIDMLCEELTTKVASSSQVSRKRLVSKCSCLSN